MAMDALRPYECRQQSNTDCPMKQIVVDGVKECRELIEATRDYPTDTMFLIAAEAQIKLARGEELLDKETNHQLGDCRQDCKFATYILKDTVNPYFRIEGRNEGR
jgi:hypothetical protein